MSNLLDKASIILTPTAYNNGEALCVKPSDGSGDFDFSRNSAATRVNAQGLVENVQILSSNLVQNGSFSEEGVQEVSNGSFSQEGVELITNGDFSSNTDWSFIGDTIIQNGVAEFPTSTSSYLIQTNAIPLSVKTYKLQYEVITTNGNDFRLAGGNSAFGTIFLDSATIGVKTIYIVSNGAKENLQFYNSNFIGSIDNVSVREVGQDWTLGTGWSIGEDKAVYSDGAKFSQLKQTLTNNNTSYYKVTFDAVINSGQFRVKFGSNNYDIITTTDTYTIYGIFSASNTNITFEDYDDISSDFSITNISVKEVGQNWDVINADANNYVEFGDGTARLKFLNISPVTQIVSQSFNWVSGKKYKLTIDIAEVTSGSFKVDLYGGQEVFNSVGINERFVEAVGSGVFTIYRNSPNVDITLNSISVIEITDDTNLPRINYEGFSYQDALGSELVVNGDFATDSDWTKLQGTTISGGVANINSTNAYNTILSQTLDVIEVGKTYKIKFSIGGNPLDFKVGLGSLSQGSFSDVITSSGDYEIDITQTNGAAPSSITFLTWSTAIQTFTIDNVSVKEYLGQEVVPDSGCGSWLWEPQSTNLLPYSEDFSQWDTIGTPTITSNFGTSPDGTQNADRVQMNIGDRLFESSSTPNVSFSVYAKSNSGLNHTISMRDGGGVVTYDMVITDEWQRFDVYLNTTMSNVQFRAFEDNIDVLFWGAQVEALSYPTSLIPTEGSSVTRNQDLCTNGGSLASINSTSGVLYAEIAALSNDGTTRRITLKGSTSNDRLNISFSPTTNRIQCFGFVGGILQFNFTPTLTDVTQFNKIALKYKENDFAIWVNGVEVLTDTSGITWSANTLNQLIFADQSTSEIFFGKTKAVAVFPYLSDAELTELTTI